MFLLGVFFAVISIVNLLWPGRTVEWAGGEPLTHPIGRLVTRLVSLWMLYQGLAFMGVPVRSWLPLDRLLDWF